MIKSEVYCTLQIDATHNWPGCPFEEVAYLRDPHRHMFHIKAFKLVTHSDRDVEFIMLKHAILKYFSDLYYNRGLNTHVFGAMSCEMLATALIKEFELSRCEVNEDGENGAILTVVEDTTPFYQKSLVTG